MQNAQDSHQAPALQITDCHHHVYDADWPVDPRAVLFPPPAPAQAYLELRRRLGMSRSVLIQPSTYGFDNRGLCTAIQQLGPECTRGVAVVEPDAHTTQLQALKAAGVVALRVNIQLSQAITRVAEIGKIAVRCAEMGWHLELNAPAAVIAEHGKSWLTLPCPLVMDHMGNLPAQPGSDHPAAAVMAALLDRGNTWVKLSGPYFAFASRPVDPAHVRPTGLWFVRNFPQRLLWGSNWPHPTESVDLHPDDAGWLDEVRTHWLGDDKTRRLVLQDNPAERYGFG